MVNYFCSPTRIYFANDCENNVGKVLKELNFKKILLVYGKSSAKKSGLYDKIIKILKDNQISFNELSQIEVNPTIDKVNEGIKIYKKDPFELVLAMGGGSVIDTSKAIANGVYYLGNPMDFNLHLAIPKKALPVGVILTIPAAGSELSTSCVIQDPVTRIKSGFNSETNRPLFVFEDPLLTLGLPFVQIGYGITDILAHSMERYFSLSCEHEFADYMALGLMKSVVDAGNILLNDFNNLQARKTLLLASSFSHNGLTSIMKDMTMPVHQLEHVLSGRHQNIAHGAGLAVLFPFWMKETYRYDVKKFAKFAKVVFNVNEGDDLSCAEKGINEYIAFLNKFSLPHTLQDLSIKEEELEEMAQSFATRKILGIRPLDYSLAKTIYMRAWKGE